jgi:hypothetical protein
MNDRLEVPDELEHLIEKRELEDRRKEQRRKEAQQSPPTPTASDESESGDPPLATDDEGDQIPDRRSGEERRQYIRRIADRLRDEGC